MCIYYLYNDKTLMVYYEYYFVIMILLMVFNYSFYVYNYKMPKKKKIHKLYIYDYICNIVREL